MLPKDKFKWFRKEMSKVLYNDFERDAFNYIRKELFKILNKGFEDIV